CLAAFDLLFDRVEACLQITLEGIGGCPEGDLAFGGEGLGGGAGGASAATDEGNLDLVAAPRVSRSGDRCVCSDHCSPDQCRSRLQKCATRGSFAIRAASLRHVGLRLIFKWGKGSNRLVQYNLRERRGERFAARPGSGKRLRSQSSGGDSI